MKDGSSAIGASGGSTAPDPTRWQSQVAPLQSVPLPTTSEPMSVDGGVCQSTTDQPLVSPRSAPGSQAVAVTLSSPQEVAERRAAARERQSNEAVAMGRSAYAESHNDGHWVNEAARFWDGVQVDNDRAVGNGERGALAATFVDLGAKTMGFFVDMSGIRQVRDRSAQLGAEVGGGASGWEVTKTSAMLTGEVALAAANGLGVGGLGRAAAVSREGVVAVRAAEEAASTTRAVVGKVIQEGGEAAGTVAKVAEHGGAQAAKATGTVIKGMTAASGQAAKTVASEMHAVIATLPETGKVTGTEAKAFFTELQKVASKYGITLKEAGTAGEAVSTSAREVSVSLAAGAPHEMVHALQMVQTRATALASEATRLGVDVTALSATQAEKAYTTTVRVFEDQAYRVFEEGAFQATGVGGRAGAPAYRQALTDGVDAFATGLSTGTAPKLARGLAARIYGDLTILGRSQAEIGDKLAMGSGAIINQEIHQ